MKAHFFLKRFVYSHPLSLALLTALTISAFLFNAKASNSAEVKLPVNNVAGTNLNVVPQPQNTSTPELQSELITISRYGIDPRELTRPAGSFLVVLENRSGLQSITLQLKKEDGEVVKEIQLTLQESDWSGVITLPAGRYSLSETSHQGWNCAIVTE